MLGLLPWWILTLMLSFINAENEANSKPTTYLNFLLTKNTTEHITIAPKLTHRHSSNHSFQKLVTLPPRPPGHYYQNSRWGPFFEEGTGPFNMTVRVGTTVRMNCKIGLLHDKTVTWVHRKGDTIHLLTVARQPYSTDQRITLSFRYPNNWRLQITSVTKRDDGLYECQVATHPPTIKRVYLRVTAPEVAILDEAGKPFTDRYYKYDSHIHLCCSVVEMIPSVDTITWWKANTLLVKGITTFVNTTTGTAVSNFTIPQAQRRHSGNYTCSVGQLTAASVFVHILNGDVPAAVHDGSSGTIASCFIATWLLTLGCFIGTDCLLCR